MSLSLPTVELSSGSAASTNLAASGKFIDCAFLNTEASQARKFQRALWTAFAEPFTLVDVDSGELMHAGYDGLSCGIAERLNQLAYVSRRGKPEIIEDAAPLVMLAIPLPLSDQGPNLVAVGMFSQLQVEAEHQVAEAASVFGVDTSRAYQWLLGREIWSPRILKHLAESILENFVNQAEITRLHSEINDAVRHARDAYIELGLLHRLTRNLHLSNNESELWQNALSWLADSVQAKGLAIVANPAVEDYQLAELFTDDIDGVWAHGDVPLAPEQLRQLIEQFGNKKLSKPIILNQAETSLATWHFPEVRELVCVPIKDGEQTLAWLLAINHSSRSRKNKNDFGSVELRLLSSVGTILGIHSNNLGLYQNQSELFSGLVASMISAIDAKDSYTSGHSDRVAKMSVALAEKLGLDKDTIDTIHLGGLLHDIGKIGVDDTILNKPDRLTDEEFDHIKQHPQFGYDILSGIRELNKVLPIVLHHHENWDGTGYPHGLAGTETPLMARIVAVADAYDAMGSDRPYRKGMSDEKIDGILRSGAGSQWDAEVVEAFFAIREELHDIVAESYLPESSTKEFVAVE